MQTDRVTAVECFFLLVVFVVVLVGANRLASWLRGPHAGVGAALHQLARNHHGLFRSGRFRQPPSARLQYGDTWITISGGSRRLWGLLTRACVDWHDRQLALEIWSKQRPARVGPAAWPHGVVTKDAAFDERFLVRGNQPAAALKWLSDGVRWQLLRLDASFRQPGHLHVLIQRGVMTVEKGLFLRQVDSLEEFRRMVLELYDQAMLTYAEGIEFLDQETAQLLDDPICQVCGEPIGTDMVFCRRCRTPHHLECWQYLGKCSIFGCDGQQYVVPRMSPRVEP